MSIKETEEEVNRRVQQLKTRLPQDQWSRDALTAAALFSLVEKKSSEEELRELKALLTTKKLKVWTIDGVRELVVSKEGKWRHLEAKEPRVRVQREQVTWREEKPVVEHVARETHPQMLFRLPAVDKRRDRRTKALRLTARKSIRDY